MAKEHVHALKGLACRKRVAAASSPAATASRLRRSRRLRDTLAGAPGLLAHASVTETVKFCRMGPKLRHMGVHARHLSHGGSCKQNIRERKTFEFLKVIGYKCVLCV